MRVVSAMLQGEPVGRDAGSFSPLLHDLLWAHAVPSIGLEHITVRPIRAGMEAVLFVRADSDTHALDCARDLLARARGPIAAHGYAALLPSLLGGHPEHDDRA
ncbi:hypothetical protein [Streptomyces purpureus]|uniref:Uncharacterized protein n=1 Tax=Streptomyces purpureus TaxID=1951 RepID=A0A918LLW5_9ACTN|nr:hypothetical protein [Streptomyces purpureus]GGT21110.1 hypothetical protein GCM10014713_12520 [Streptomyces purpureus]